MYAKSNVPEFGAGGNTFNEVFGPTLNPWDTTRSVAGLLAFSAFMESEFDAHIRTPITPETL